MRVLISAVGTRGDIQPAVALALELRAAGHEPRLCIPPNFTDWAADLGFDARPVGIEMRAPRGGAASTAPPSVADLVTDQFESVGSAAVGCHLIVGGGAHQYAARSIAELRGIPFVDAVYAPVSLPSRDHAPPGTTPVSQGETINLQMWGENRRRWDERFLEPVNANRARLGLGQLDDLLSHILGSDPWLAADPLLAPLPSTPGLGVVQTGAWVLADTAPLPPPLEAFLAAGEPPVYLGFGSMPVIESAVQLVIDAVHAVGRRVILSRGWADLGLVDKAAGAIAIDDVNHQALFPRVAAVVHHGGAGTTTAAASAGAPQVLVPMFMDQFYWGQRVTDLDIGRVVPFASLEKNALVSALNDALGADRATRAGSLAAHISRDGAAVAARRLIAQFQ